MKRTFESSVDASAAKPRSHWGKPGAILSTLILSLSVSAASLQAQAPKTLSAKTLSQFDAIKQEQATRTPAQRKLDSQLIYAAREAAGEAAVKNLGSLHSKLGTEADGRVRVRIRATPSAELDAAIAALKGTVEKSFPKYRAVYARLPLTSLEKLAERADVEFVEPPPQVFNQNARWSQSSKPTAVNPAVSFDAPAVATPPGPRPAEVDTAQNNPEGDATHGAAKVRQQYGINGSGFGVGVISNSINDPDNSYATAVNNGYVPNNIFVPSGQAGSSQEDGEGLAMLEVVHRIAPGAALAFASADGGPEQTAENILTMANKGYLVILDDIGFTPEDPFQDDTVSLAINEAASKGVLYFSSAANNYNFDSGVSSCWEGNFKSTANDSYLDFTPGSGAINELNGTNSFQNGTTLSVLLYFAEPLNGATSQYNIYEVDSNLDVVQSATTSVSSSHVNYQGFRNVTPGDAIVVQLVSGAARYLHLEISDQFAYFDINTPGRTRGHNAGLNTFCCAATPAYMAQTGVPYQGPSGPYPNLFNSSDDVELFSDDGPRHIFFNPNGSAITPGNLTASGGRVLAKPDFTAADGVTTSVPQVGGDSPFFGTSCAAPHAGALAALAWSADPYASPGDIAKALYNGCVQITDHGTNNRDSGAGILVAPKIITALANIVTPTITGFTPTSGKVGTTVTINGTRLGVTNNVYFNQTVVTQGKIVSDTQITAVVPDGATTGKITVVTAEGQVTSAGTFTVTAGSTAPSITSAASASATQGKAFSYKITATNSPTHFGAVGLPPGLTINATTGVISGTPTKAGKFNLTLKAANAAGTGQKAFTLTVTGAPPAITSAATATATVGKAFSYKITATNSPTSFGVVGLKPGLSVNKTTGVISGTPTGAPGKYTLTLKAANAAGATQKNLALTINAK